MSFSHVTLHFAAVGQEVVKTYERIQYNLAHTHLEKNQAGTHIL